MPARSRRVSITGEAGSRSELADRFGLPLSHLQGQDALLHVGNHRADRVEAVVAGEQRLARLPCA